MNIIKKIAVILPVIAIGLFIYTLNFIDKKQTTPSGMAIESYISDTVTTTTVSSFVNKNTNSKTVTDAITKQETTTTQVAKTETTTVYTGVVTNVVTPFSKISEALPLQEVKQSSVVTPSEIVIESIPLVYQETTTDGISDTSIEPEDKGDVPFVTTAPDLTTTTDVIFDTNTETTTTIYTESEQNALFDNTEVSESTDTTTTTMMVSKTTTSEDTLLN